MMTMVTRKRPPPMPAPTMASIESSRTRSDDGEDCRNANNDKKEGCGGQFFLLFF